MRGGRTNLDKAGAPLLTSPAPAEPILPMAIDGDTTSRQTLDPKEVERFAALAADWWDPNGKFRPLHELNPVRLTYIRDHLCRHFGRDPRAAASLKELTVLDIGCGGGLLCEPLARLGAQVTGVDPAEESIAAARQHASGEALDIAYLASRAEDVAAQGAVFDAVLTMEVVEHVPDVPAFLALCADLVRPGGLLLLSTINRTLKSYALAIVGAEYILRWLPVGTHQWDRFVTPTELTAGLEAAGLGVLDSAGMVYNPLLGDWRLAADKDVNYLMAAVRPASTAT